MAVTRSPEHDIYPCQDNTERTGDCDYEWCGCKCHKVERTPGRNDFGRFDPTDDPQVGDVHHKFALNHGALRVKTPTEYEAI